VRCGWVMIGGIVDGRWSSGWQAVAVHHIVGATLMSRRGAANVGLWVEVSHRRILRESSEIRNYEFSEIIELI
jgi:hypothetical protein